MMYKNVISKLALVFLIGVSNVGFSQETEEVEEKNKPSLETGRIEQQYDYLVTKSNNFQEYKVIKKAWVGIFKNSLADTLEVKAKEKKELLSTIGEQEKTIGSLNTEMTAVKNSLNSVEEEKNNMAWLGIAMTKATYRTIMWSLFGVVCLLWIVFTVLFKNSNVVTKQAKGTLSDVEEEFAEYKKKSLEREQKLRRELQDEINKQRS